MSAGGRSGTLPTSGEAALPRRDPAWAASVRPGGRSSKSVVFCIQMMYFLCSDVYYPLRHPAESRHASHSATSCLCVCKCHRKFSKIQKNSKVKRFKVLKYAFAVVIVAFDYARCCQSMQHGHGGGVFFAH